MLTYEQLKKRFKVVPTKLLGLPKDKSDVAPADGLAAVEALRKERDDLRECLKGADDRNLKLGQKLQAANAALAAANAQKEEK